MSVAYFCVFCVFCVFIFLCILHCALIFLCLSVSFSSVSIAELRAEAEALGLEGEEALSFVYIYKQQEFYMNERAVERTARAEEA